MALFLVIGALIANAALKPSRGVASGGILGGPSTSNSGQEEVAATFIGVPQVISSAEAATPIAVNDSLSTPSLKDDLASITPDSSSFQGLAGANSVLDSLDEPTGAGQSIVPDETPKASSKHTSHYFIQPAAGLNWGILHGHNAVDIANACGTPVVAAAGGVVIDSSDSGGWNGGYGNFLYIQHPNGTKTKYAHLQTLEVSSGDEVSQGQEIGKMGDTGHSTGCHLHFEVNGAANPFAKK